MKQVWVMDVEKFRAAVDQYCRTHGLSRNRLADRVGISRSMLCRMYRGNRIGLGTSVKVCRRIGVKRESLGHYVDRTV